MSAFHLKPQRFLVFTKRRTFTDPVAWTIFFLIAIAFRFLDQFYQYASAATNCGTEKISFLLFFLKRPCGASVDAFEVISIVVRENLFYTFVLLIPVYVNLIFFKKYILDKIQPRVLSYSLYLLLVFVNAVLFALLLFFILKNDTFLLSEEVGVPFNILVIMGVQLIATGLVYRREVVYGTEALHKLDVRIQNKKQQLADLKIEFENIRMMMEDAKGILDMDHLKLGSKNSFEIIPYSDIIYFKADGNEPNIYLSDGSVKPNTNRSLNYYEAILPKSLFIRVHRSYLVAKSMVIERKGNALMLKGVKEEIPIGNTYKDILDHDSYLGFSEKRKKRGLVKVFNDWFGKENLEVHPKEHETS